MREVLRCLSLHDVMKLFDKGFAVRGIRGDWLMTANGTSMPQIMLFSEERWATLTAINRGLGEEDYEVYKVELVRKEGDKPEYLQSGFVKTYTYDGLESTHMQRIGWGNRAYAKLYKRRGKEDDHTKWHEAAFEVVEDWRKE